MKNFIICAAVLLIASALSAQNSSFLNFQGVARNADSEIIDAQEIGIRLSIILDNGNGNGDGTIIYTEEHNDLMTTDFGVFNLKVGEGNPLFGNWDNIDWSEGEYWLKTDFSPENDGSFDYMGLSPFNTVPFALHAKTVEDKDDADADPGNELQSLSLSGSEISISNGNSVDLAGIIPPGGSDDQNISLNGTVLQIEGGNSVDLAPLLPPGGSDDQTLILNGTFLEIEGGNTIDLSALQDGVNDADSDPTNEVQSLGLNGAELSITNGNSVDLGPLLNSGGNQNLSLNGTVLQIDGGNSVDLAPILPPGGTDDQNLSLNGTSLQIEGGNSVDLSALQDGVNDADADPANELQTLSLNGNEISISDGNTLDLSFLSGSSLWSENSGTVYKNSGKVGIGLDETEAKLQVKGDANAPVELLLDGTEDNSATMGMLLNENGNTSTYFYMDANSNGNGDDNLNMSFVSTVPNSPVGIGLPVFSYNSSFGNPITLHRRTNVSDLLNIRPFIATGNQDEEARMQLTLESANTEKYFNIRASNAQDSNGKFDISYFYGDGTGAAFIEPILSFDTEKFYSLNLGQATEVEQYFKINSFGNEYAELSWAVNDQTALAAWSAELRNSSIGGQYKDLVFSAEYDSSISDVLTMRTDDFGNEVEVNGFFQAQSAVIDHPSNVFAGNVLFLTTQTASNGLFVDHNTSDGTGVFIGALNNSKGLEIETDGNHAITTLGGKVGFGNQNPDHALVVGTPIGSSWAHPAVTVGGTNGGVFQAGTSDASISILAQNFNGTTNNVISSNGNASGNADMHINTTGLLLGNISANQTGLGVYSMKLNQSAGYGLALSNISSGDTWELYSSVTGNLSIYAGSNFAGSWDPNDGIYTPSDRSFKTDITAIGTVLPSLMNLDVKRYRYLENNPDQKLSLGLIAQDVQKLFPELVIRITEREESKLLMNYAGLGVIAVKAIQEQQELLEKQEKTLLEQAEKIKDLEEKIRRIEQMLSDR